MDVAHKNKSSSSDGDVNDYSESLNDVLYIGEELLLSTKEFLKQILPSSSTIRQRLLECTSVILIDRKTMQSLRFHSSFAFSRFEIEC